MYLRLDTIEQAIKSSTKLSVGPEGYDVAYALAFDNLKNGLNVVADSVNSLAVTRKAWRETALAADSSFIDIEIVCSDAKEHRRRIEARKPAIRGLVLSTWRQVANRDYAEWTGASHFCSEYKYLDLESLPFSYAKSNYPNV